MNSPTVRCIPLSPGSCWHFGEGEQNSSCLRAETFEHQYFIAKTNYIAVYKSHRAVCSFIEVVQNTYGTASPPSGTGGKGGDSPRVGRHGAEGRPSRGCWCPGEGALGMGEAGGCPCVREPGAPIMCIMGGATRGDTELEELNASHAHTQAAFSPPGPTPAPSPGPWGMGPVLEPGKAPQPPGDSGGWEMEKICWNEALKKTEMEPGSTKGPPLVSVSYSD